MAWALVDDDPERNLRLKAASGASGVDLDVWRSHVLDVSAILRVELPDAVVLGRLGGRETSVVARAFRSCGFDGPLLVLGDDRPAAFLGAGADAVLPADADWEDVQAQVSAVKRRVMGLTNGLVSFGGLAYDPAEAVFSANGARLALSEMRSRLLLALFEKRGRVVGSQELGRRVWGLANAGSRLHYHIHLLRQSLEKAGLPGYVRYEPGRGYVLEPPPPGIS